MATKNAWLRSRDLDNSSKDYQAEIDIYGLNRSGLLNDVLQILSNSTKSISTVNAQPTKDMKFANIHVSFGIPNLTHLTTVVEKSRQFQMFIAWSGPMAKKG